MQALTRSSRGAFRLVHFSVQTDHLHLIVEAETSTALFRGVQGLVVRCARAVNRAGNRRGPVWLHRYHAHALRTPREVRHALVYVLLNFRKHLRAGPAIDPRSSGPWFDGWAHAPPAPCAAPPVAQSRTWLGTVGWRRAGGAIDCREAPASALAPTAVQFRSDFASTSRSTGLTRWPSKPASVERRRSVSCPYPVRAIMRRLRGRPSSWRRRRATS